MCKMIFMGVSEKIEEIPWNEESPGFFLQKPLDEETDVIANFTKPYIYFIGTKRGCSCDFIIYSNLSKEEYRAERLAFAKIIYDQIAKGNSVEVYCCWASDYASVSEEKSLADYASISNAFYIGEKEMLVYKPN